VTLAGIFVGGAARRMDGAPKGLLPAPDTGEALVVRAARCCVEAGIHIHTSSMEVAEAITSEMAAWLASTCKYTAFQPPLS
jgi:hypothetical protein